MADHGQRHGYAAFAAEDREDAARRRPPGDLRAYAAERGLEYRGRGSLAGFRMALPRFAEEQFDLLRGVLPGGRFGVLLHQLLQTHRQGGVAVMQGAYHGVNPGRPRGLLRGLIPNRTDIPILGDFLDPGTRKGEPEPFEDIGGAWAPTTTVGVPVPETVAPLGRVIFVLKRRSAPFGDASVVDLDDHGLPTWRAALGPHVDGDVLARALAGPLGATLRALGDRAYAEVRLDHGMLTVRRNGYVMDPAALDAFAAGACAAADGLRDACLVGVGPADFGAPLSPARWATTGDQDVFSGLPAAWARDFRDFAARHALALEDERAWHATFPSAPIPGRALAVMRAPGGGRVLFPVDEPVEATRAVRGAIAFPVAEGSAPVPPGGRPLPDHTMVVAVAGGLGAVWSTRHYGFTSEADTLVADALGAAAEADVVPAAGVGWS